MASFLLPSSASSVGLPSQQVHHLGHTPTAQLGTQPRHTHLQAGTHSCAISFKQGELACMPALQDAKHNHAGSSRAGSHKIELLAHRHPPQWSLRLPAFAGPPAPDPAPGASGRLCASWPAPGGMKQPCQQWQSTMMSQDSRSCDRLHENLPCQRC